MDLNSSRSLVSRRPSEWLGRHRPLLEVVLVAGAMLGAAALFLANINLHGLWQDEGVTAHVVASPLATFARHLVFSEPGNATYYVAVRGWSQLFGTSEAGLRSLSLLAAVATLPFVYLIGRRLGGLLPATAAVVIFVLNPFVLDYAVEARAYALGMLLVTAASWLLLRAVDESRRGRWVGYAVVMAAGVWMHFYALFVVLAHGLWIVTLRPEARRPALLAVGAVLVAAAPLGLAILFWGPGREWIAAPSLSAALAQLLSVLGSRSRGVAGAALALSVTAALVALFGALVWWAPRHTQLDREGEGQNHGAGAAWRARALVALWAVVPIGAGLAVSVAKPVFIARSLIVVVPALELVVAAALSLLRGRWLRAGALVVLVTLALLQALVVLPNPKADWRGSFQAMAPKVAAGDKVIVYPVRLAWETAEYYIDRFPQLHQVQLLNRPTTTRQNVLSMVDEVGGTRVWLVAFNSSLATPHDGLLRLILGLQARGYELRATQTFHRLELALFVPTTTR